MFPSCFFQLFPGFLIRPSYSHGRWHSSPARQKWIRTQLRPPGAWHPKWRPRHWAQLSLLVLRWDVMTKMSLRFPWINGIDAPQLSPMSWRKKCLWVESVPGNTESVSDHDSYQQLSRSFCCSFFPVRGQRVNGSNHKASWSFARAFTLSSGFARVSCESFCRKSPESCKPECLGGHETCASLRSVYFLFLYFLSTKVLFLRSQKAWLAQQHPHIYYG